MNLFSVRTLMVGLLTMMIGVTFTGCGIPVNLSETVDLIKNVEIPARPEAPDDIREIPEEFYQYVENWEEFETVEDFMNTPFQYQQAESFCKLPNLKEIQDKAAEKLPPFLARKIEVRSVAVRAIRIIAETGDFNSLDELENVLTVDGADYLFSISAEEGGGVIIWLTPTPTLDLADLINNPDFDGCVENALRLVATLPESEIVFKAVLDLDISLYLRIL